MPRYLVYPYLLPILSSFSLLFFFFFFNDTSTTEIYTLSLHDALPISFSRLIMCPTTPCFLFLVMSNLRKAWRWPKRDRKSTRLNSSHTVISYAVFCLKKKNRR